MASKEDLAMGIIHRNKQLGAVILGFCGLIVLASTIIYAYYYLTFHAADFKAYYLAAIRFTAGEPLYSPGPFLGQVQGLSAEKYLYPPIVVLVFIPFLALPVMMGAFIWVTIQAVLVYAALLILLKSIDADTILNRVILAFTVFAYYPTLRWMQLGQVTGLITALITFAGATTIARRSEIQSGAAFAVVALIKPFYAPSGAGLVRDIKRVLSILAIFILLIYASLLLFGINTHVDYLGVLQTGKGWGIYHDQPLGHRPLYAFGVIGLIVKAGLILAVFITTLRYRNATGRQHRALFSLGVIVVAIAGPTANTLTLATTLPAYVVMTVDEWRYGGLPTLPIGCYVATHVSKITLLQGVSVISTVVPGLLGRITVQSLITIQPSVLGLVPFLLLTWYRVVKPM